jgi:hypothetical protein
MGFKRDDGTTEWREGPIKDHTGAMTFPVWDVSPIISGTPLRGERIDVSKLSLRALHGNYRQILGKTGADASYQIIAPTQLCQTLYKIGHSFAVAELGLSGFRPLLRDAIRGQKRDTFDYVGGGDVIYPFRPGCLHAVLLNEVRNFVGARVLLANLQLFAADNAATYQVTVGYLGRDAPLVPGNQLLVVMP